MEAWERGIDHTMGRGGVTRDRGGEAYVGVQWELSVTAGGQPGAS